MTHPRTIAIIQARLGSSRLPGKVLKPLGGVAAIDRVLDRLALAQSLDGVIVATSDTDQDDPLVAHLVARGTAVARGPLEDVLARFGVAAQAARAETIVRITADCPFIDPAILDRVVALHHASGADYTSNVEPPTWPDGMDTEVFSRARLRWMLDTAETDFEREHVTPRLRRHPEVHREVLTQDSDQSHLRLTLDEPADLRLLDALWGAFDHRRDVPCGDVVAYMHKHADQLDLGNQTIIRDEGARMGKGQKLWRRAKGVIPGGSMLFSKRAEMLAPDQWPAYFSRARGTRVWDLDDREMIDMAYMGVGTNSLGYGHPDVDAAVLDTVQAGNMTTLNAPEEVALAERLIELHPFAEMARFTRSGGEANAVAIRIARAASGRDGVAICGYHGWHDWYLSANLGSDKNLDGHLLPGLEPNGVPRELAGTVHPFRHNDLPGLRAVIDRGDVGVIKMEVMRNAPPEPGFLETVRAWADEKDIVLIFDECTSGFRETYGGLHKTFGVEPDMAIFGKALGNGYAINAVIGTRAVMEAAQSTFISSTFWTERIGPSAALATLKVMEREESWTQITQTGARVNAGWQELADSHGLKISIAGLPAIAAYGFDVDDPQQFPERARGYKTLVAQEMLKAGFLATTAFYASTAHTEADLAAYFAALDPVFARIARIEAGAESLAEALEGPIVHGGFQRLN